MWGMIPQSANIVASADWSSIGLAPQWGNRRALPRLAAPHPAAPHRTLVPENALSHEKSPIDAGAPTGDSWVLPTHTPG